MIKRLASDYILKVSNQFPVVLIQGPRQSGKTTLARALFSNKAYFSFEYPDIREVFEADPREFLNRIPSEGAIFDEIQNVPKLLSYLQGIVDEEKVNGKYILTGSSNFKIMDSVSQSLAGRCGICKLLPLSIKESALGNTDEQIFTGGYPRIHSLEVDANEYYRSYIETYVEKDIRRTLNIKDFKAFERFITALAIRVGSFVDYASLSNDCGISVNTVKQWLSVLEESYIVYLLPAWYMNRSKRLVKANKIYFFDTGLVCNLLKISNYEQLSNEKLRGSLFENLIILEKLKDKYNTGSLAEFYYYRTSNGVEVDLIEEHSARVSAFEIKSSSTFNSDYLKGLLAFKKDYSDIVDSLFVIYTGEWQGVMKGCNIVNYMGNVQFGFLNCFGKKKVVLGTRLELA